MAGPHPKRPTPRHAVAVPVLAWIHTVDPWVPSALLGGWILAWSILGHLHMALDKKASRTRGKRRTPERRLLGLALVGGAPGIWLAMHRLRHKTKHARFRILVPAAAVLWLGALLTSLVLWLQRN